MYVSLRSNGRRVAIKQPQAGDLSVHTKAHPCSCGALPATVAGIHPVTEYDHVTAEAHCVDCGAYIGVLTVKASTIFGLDEDRRVLEQGRCRVY